jgi:hypothetical protein
MGLLTGALGMLVGGAKSLIGSKTTKEVLKFLASTTLSHACSKFAVNQYKFDPNDMKNMVYHYNMNSNHCIDKNEVDTMTNLMNINRFMNDLPSNDDLIEDPMTKLVDKLTQFTNDNHILHAYNNMLENSVIQQFDYDTLETSSIADSYEISSGDIYLPDRNIIITTDEGQLLADAKNEYLEERIRLGDDASKDDIKILHDEFYNKIEFDKVLQYFNN